MSQEINKCAVVGCTGAEACEAKKLREKVAGMPMGRAREVAETHLNSSLVLRLCAVNNTESASQTKSKA